MTENSNAAVLSVGEKVHVAFRRLFAGDVRRHFVGEIMAVDGDRVRAEGYVFLFQEGRNEYERKPEKRTRVFSLATHLNLNVIPASTNLDAVVYHVGETGLVATDSAAFTLNISELA